MSVLTRGGLSMLLWWATTGSELSDLIIWYARKLNELPATLEPAKNIQSIFAEIATIDRSVRVTHVEGLAQKVPYVLKDIRRCLDHIHELTGIERDDLLWFTETSSVCLKHCICFLSQLLPKLGMSVPMHPELQEQLHNRIMSTEYYLDEKTK